MGSMWGWPRMKKNTQVSLFQNISLQRLPRPTLRSAWWTFTCLQGHVTSRPSYSLPTSSFCQDSRGAPPSPSSPGYLFFILQASA